jgi:hypothetical protein
MDNVPCENCVTYAICRHKSFSSIVKCPIVCKYIEQYTFPTYFECRLALYRCLKPTRWAVDDHGRFTSKTIHKTIHKTISEY